MVSILMAVEGSTKMVIYPCTRAVGLRAVASSEGEEATRGDEGAAADRGDDCWVGSGEKSVDRDMLVTACTAPVVVVVPMGGLVIFRGDLVHCGVCNPSGATYLRVHWHLAREDLVHIPWGNYTQYVWFAP